MDLSSTALVFMGTPQFAVPPLKALLQAGIPIKAVVTQPDRPSGRGKKMTPPPVKTIAIEQGIPVWQPETVLDAHFQAQIKEIAPTLIVVAAYGQILPKDFLQIPKLGILNIHASLLPLYRGAAPINWAIIHGRSETGVTLMQIEEGLDTGPIFAKEKTPIFPDDDAVTLHNRLSKMGANLLLKTLPFILNGKIKPIPQDHSLATYAPMLKKEMGQISWQSSARDLFNLVRGLVPWPGTYTFFKGKRLKIKKTMVVSEDTSHQGIPGEVVSTREGIDVLTGKGLLRLLELQAEGARAMDYKAFLSGHSIQVGEVIGE